MEGEWSVARGKGAWGGPAECLVEGRVVGVKEIGDGRCGMRDAGVSGLDVRR